MIQERLDTRVVGRNLPKPDAIAKVTGHSHYVADLVEAGMLYGKAVRAPHAHALISKIDNAKALALPGVIKVITAADIPGRNNIGHSGWKDQPVLAFDKVRFYGEAVALVVAETAQAAEAAAGLVEVRYDPLPGLYDPRLAMDEDTPLVHPESNLCSHKRIVRGDVNEAFQTADIVVEKTYSTPYIEHGYIEPDAAVATWDGDKLSVWSSTKSVHHDREEISRVVGLPKQQVRVSAATIGGSFGGKSDIPLVCMVSILAFLTKRPVKMVYSREECMQVTTKRHPYIVKYKTAANKDGLLTAIQMEVLADAGAYTAFSPSVVARAVIHGAGPYRVPNVFLEGKSVFTNNPVSGAMRGYGTPQIFFGLEQQMDMMAEALGIDPFSFRMKNLVKAGDVTVTNQVLGRGTGALEALNEVHRQFAVAAPAAEPEKTRYPWCQSGWGIANFYYGNGRTGQYNPGTAILRLDDDGCFRLFIGSPDIGQGSDTAMAQIAAEAVGINIDRLEVVSADTDVTLDSGTTSGTRLTYVVGNGVLDAGKKMQALIKEAGAACLAVTADAIVIDNDGISAGEKKAAWDQLSKFAKGIGLSISTLGRFDPPTTDVAADTGDGRPYGTFTFGTQMVKITVNTLTGKIDVEKVHAVYDVGLPLNPMLLEGQFEGGIAGGLGYTLMEEVVVKDGRVINNNLDSYLIPTSLDVGPIESGTLPLPEDSGPYGAKGIGEPALIPTAAAVANALYRATGVRLYDLPLTPERIIAALAERSDSA